MAEKYISESVEAYGPVIDAAVSKARLLQGISQKDIKKWDDEFLNYARDNDIEGAVKYLNTHPSKEYQQVYRNYVGLGDDEPFTAEALNRPLGSTKKDTY